jgi:serine/threonine-protein kinase RsbW
VSASIELDLRQDLAELGVVGERLAAFAAANGIAEDVVLQVNLALEELITNIIMHAQADSACHIHLRLSLDAGALTAVLSDDAAAFDPLTMPAPDITAPLEERSVGGLGIHLVRSLIDQVDYQRQGGRNQTTLIKHLAGNRGRAAPPAPG